MSKIETKNEDDLCQTQNNVASSSSQPNSNKITFDQIASVLLKQNLILTALELHTELSESGRELPRLRDYFSNPANFEQQNQANNNLASSLNSGAGFYPLHKASSIQTFDSLDLTRYSDDVDQNKFQDDKIAVLEFELRKAKETINQLRNTLTLATENQSSNMSKSSLNYLQMLDPIDKSNNYEPQTTSSNSNSKSNLLTTNISNKNIMFNLNDNEFEEEYDLFDQNQINDIKTKSNHKINQLMPHDKNAINFLINEYLLENNYKMTSVTFSEENESQDLEDWDVVGLNRSKPPNLHQLYKLYLNKSKLNGSKKENFEKKDLKSKTQCTENSTQTEYSILIENSSNTDLIITKNFESIVNFDRDTFENQKMQINKLLEKQEILIKSLTKLENEIITLNSERENNLKKIDLLTVNLEKALKNENKTNLNGAFDTQEDTKEAEEITIEDKNNEKLELDRKIPVVFKEILNKYSNLSIHQNDKNIIEEIQNLKLDNHYLIKLFYKYIPIVTPYVSVEKRLDLLPLILLGAILELENQKDKSSNNNNKLESNFIKLLFNLYEKPNLEQRSFILQACIQYTKLVGPIYVNNYLLSECWEQLNDKIDEKRILIAEACFILAPYIYNDIRSSLMFSILKQLIEQESSEPVKVSAVKSLAILVNYMKDEQKFLQCIDLLDLCITDSSQLVIKQVEELLMPSLSLWSLNINKFSNTLIMHLLNKADIHIVNSNRQKYRKNESDIIVDHEKHAYNYMNLLNLNIQFIFGYILIHFRDTNQAEAIDLDFDKKLPKLNSYFHSLQEKLNFKHDLYKLDSILEDYLSLTTKYLTLIQNDLWSSIELSDAFTWLSDTFIRKLIQMSAQVDSRDQLCSQFVNLFKNFTLLFAIDYELIKSKIIPIFEKLLNIPDFENDSNQQNVLEQILCNKSCPLFKSTLPVFFVGILSTLVDVEYYGWFNLNSETLSNDEDSFNFKTESSPSTISCDKIITSSASKNKNRNKDKDENSSKTQTSLEKRLDHMSNYLRNVFFALSLNQSNLEGVICIYELMKQKPKNSDYVIQMLLSTLWDGIVHISLYVRCNTAKLFEILVKDCDEYLLSTRILPALITLANDLDKMVRCSSISPLTSIIENCTNKEILERVYTQLQSFLSDPILKDEYLLQIELIKTFRRIVVKVNSKFREEFILPYLTILTMNIKNVIHDNDYEFSLSSLTTTFLAISSFSPISPMSTSSSSSSVCSYSSIKENQFQFQQGQQQDIIKICVLLFDTYQKICLNSDDNPKPISISRQSIQESLLPGLSCLRDIFHNYFILNTTSNSSNSIANIQNDYVALLDNMIHKIEIMQVQANLSEVNASPNLNTSLSNPNQINLTPTINNNENSNSISPLKVSPVAIMTDVINASVNALSSSSTSSFSSTNTVISNGQNGTNPNNSIDTNFKSFVFKGISTFKDQSKDKLSNFLLTNKTFKK